MPNIAIVEWMNMELRFAFKWTCHAFSPLWVVDEISQNFDPIFRVEILQMPYDFSCQVMQLNFDNIHI
jgi:hypothetical protein